MIIFTSIDVGNYAKMVVVSAWGIVSIGIQIKQSSAKF